jgi:hypothetical protein
MGVGLISSARRRTAVATDPYFSSTVLLLSCDGVAGSKTFTDESAKLRGNATAGGDAQVTTGGPKFGSGSGRFDGNSDYLAYADSADFEFGSGDFTVETWALFDSTFIANNDQVLIGKWDTNGQRDWMLRYDGAAATNALSFYISTAGTATVTLLTSAWTPTAAQWYHIAVDRSGSTWRLYVDGVMLVKATSSSTIFNSTAQLRCGIIYNSSSGAVSGDLRGNLDEIRITKGVARYASDAGYTVPISAYPRS